MIHRIIILFLSLCAIAVAQPSLTNNNLDNLTPTAKDNLEALGVLTDEAGPDNAAVAAAIAEDPASSRESIGLMLGSGAPDNGDGVDGSYYIDEDSGTLYKKASGTWAVSASPSSQEVYFVTELPSSGTGNNGDLAVIYTSGLISGLAEKSGGTWSLVASAVSDRPTDSAVLSMVDHFLGGQRVTATSGVFGDLNWYCLQTIGTGAFSPASGDAANVAFIGALDMQTGATAGNTATISFAKYAGGNTFKTSALSGLTGFYMEWQFKADATNTFWLGLSDNPAAAASAPTRFAGIKASASNANFEFVCIGSSTTTVDSGVSVDTAYHTFRLTWNGTAWEMSIDGGTPVSVTSQFTHSNTVTAAAWVTAAGASAAHLYIDTFRLYGVKP